MTKVMIKIIAANREVQTVIRNLDQAHNFQEVITNPKDQQKEMKRSKYYNQIIFWHIQWSSTF